MKRLIAALILVALPALASAATPKVQTIEVDLLWNSDPSNPQWYIASGPAPFNGGYLPLIVTRPTDANKLKALDKTGRSRCRMKLDGEFLVQIPSIGSYAPVFAISTCALLPPSCTDQLKNQDESDTDCGGTQCAPCANFRPCDDGGDCTSGLCASAGGYCFLTQTVCLPATCGNGVQDGGETDIDCGGFASCHIGCSSGEACGGQCDCGVGLSCSGGTCQ